MSEETTSQDETVKEEELAEATPVAAEAGGRTIGQGAWIAIAAAALVLGLLIGRFALGGSGARGSVSALAGRTTITAEELDTPVATLTYQGTSEDITAREVINQTGSLEASMDAEGNYHLPSADATLTLARNLIIEKEAESRGLAVTDEALAAYAEETLGTSDYASIATSYGMDEDAVVSVLRSSCLMAMLRDEVVGTTSADIPEAPAYPEATDADDGTTTPTAEYAAYIIALAGDEWDDEAGTWAAADGPYAVALANYDITPEGATYEAAQTAYYVAYQLYSESVSSTTTEWSEFVNGLLANGSITLSSLVA